MIATIHCPSVVALVLVAASISSALIALVLLVNVQALSTKGLVAVSVFALLLVASSASARTLILTFLRPAVPLLTVLAFLRPPIPRSTPVRRLVSLLGPPVSRAATPRRLVSARRPVSLLLGPPIPRAATRPSPILVSLRLLIPAISRPRLRLGSLLAVIRRLRFGSSSVPRAAIAAVGFGFVSGFVLVSAAVRRGLGPAAIALLGLGIRRSIATTAFVALGAATVRILVVFIAAAARLVPFVFFIAARAAIFVVAARPTVFFRLAVALRALVTARPPILFRLALTVTLRAPRPSGILVVAGIFIVVPAGTLAVSSCLIRRLSFCEPRVSLSLRESALCRHVPPPYCCSCCCSPP